MSESQVVYAIEKSPEAAEVRSCIGAPDCGALWDDLDRMGRMIAHANLIVCARDGERLIGIARALTDFSHCCYLADLAWPKSISAGGSAKP